MIAQETSLEALASIKPHLEGLRFDVWSIIRETGGLTCDQVEMGLDMSHQTASARICELRKMGYLRPSGSLRETRSGRRAIVWVDQP